MSQYIYMCVCVCVCVRACVRARVRARACACVFFFLSFFLSFFDAPKNFMGFIFGSSNISSTHHCFILLASYDHVGEPDGLGI
jgi:hypothetical protein